MLSYNIKLSSTVVISSLSHMLTDSHAHVWDMKVLEVLKRFNIFTMATGMSPAECESLQKIAKENKHIIPNFGLHPWNANKYTVEQMMPYLSRCPVIGEIGMDNTWCKVPLDIQRKVFVEQMDFAQKRMCPVVFHSKGQEKELVDILQKYGYSMPKLVHWYSCDVHLDELIELGCYFTIGPDVHINPSQQQVAAKVPNDRILIETDGLGGIEWAQNIKIQPEDLPKYLIDIRNHIAKIKKITPEEVQNLVNENLQRFISIKLE